MAPVLMGMLLIISSSTVLFLLGDAASATAKPNTANTASSSGSLSGTLACPNGDEGPATLVFGVTRYHDYRDITGTEGNFHLAAPQPIGGVDGVLTDGHVGEKSFRVTGSESIGGACHTVNSDVVISGKCGTDVTVLYRAEDKVMGRFTGNVECHTTQSQ
jgi:hypothetical protein